MARLPSFEMSDAPLIGRYLRNEVGMPQSHVFMTGYWRRSPG